MQQYMNAPMWSGVACVSRINDSVGICLPRHVSIYHKTQYPRPTKSTHFSSSAKADESKELSHPTSTNTLTPPSNSNNDCCALEVVNCAPSNGVKVNMVATIQCTFKEGLQVSSSPFQMPNECKGVVIVSLFRRDSALSARI